jgi:hypothetical protein
VFGGVRYVPEVDGDRGESLGYDSLALYQPAYHRPERKLLQIFHTKNMTGRFHKYLTSQT